MRVFHIFGDRFTQLAGLPEALSSSGYLWLASDRREFEVGVADVQVALQRWTGSTPFDLHVTDLLNNQLPLHFDYTSGYDLPVFRRRGKSRGSHAGQPGRLDATHGQRHGRQPPRTASPAFQADRLPAKAARRSGCRLGNLRTLFDSRNSLHVLEDTCEDQRPAIVEWIDALVEGPVEADPRVQREREQLRLRSRDVLEHIERVPMHVRRLESSETAVQMQFS